MRKSHDYSLRLAMAALALGLTANNAPHTKPSSPDRWWSPNETRSFPAQLDYSNANGGARLILTDGPMNTQTHPFFRSMGANKRACVTCHQPADGMSLSAASAQKQWARNGAKDPLFAAIDGSNCPNLAQGKRAAHSLILDHGLIRIARAWPPKNATGQPIRPDFALTVLRDPTHCNRDPQWGIHSPRHQISVYRRPRPVANFKYIEAMGFAYDPKAGMPLPLDPDTHQPVSGNLMADGRALSLTAQMREAADMHLQMAKSLTPADMTHILNFEHRIFSAQQSHTIGGDLDANGAEGGPQKLASSPPGRLGSQGIPVWSEFAAWDKPENNIGLTSAQSAWRQSVARGAKMFRDRTFLITDSAGINSPVGFGNPVRNGCAFCHNMSQMGMDVAPGQIDLGTTNHPFANPMPHLPLFRIRCLGQPHPHYGRIILTSDPGYALTTGKCADVGRITLQTMRSMSARAPYFSNGSAKTLRAIIDFYDRRYTIHYTEQEKQDMTHLLEAL